MLRPTLGSGLIISWAGMRGIVSLAAALALPSAFPYRDLIVLTAFAVVLGTLVIQGLTLKPLLRALDLHDDDPVGRELRAARERALQAGLASFADDESPVADAVRQEFTAHLTQVPEDSDPDDPTRARRMSSSITRRSRRHGRPFTRCVPTTKSATMPFTRSKRNWTGSKWQVAGRRSETLSPISRRTIQRAGQSCSRCIAESPLVPVVPGYPRVRRVQVWVPR